MNKTKGILHQISESEADSESDDSVDILTEQVKDLIECDRRQIQKNVLNSEILPPKLKLRPSVVYRAFKKNTTSTPLVARGYKNFFASDSSLSPIRISDAKENDSKKNASALTEYPIKTRSGKSVQSINLEKNGVDTETNQDKSIQNSKTVISDGKNKLINSNNNVVPEISLNDCKKPEGIPNNARVTRSSLKNNLTNNVLANGTLSESINKIKSTTPKRTSIINIDSSPNSKTYNLRSTSPEKIARSPTTNQTVTIVNKALFNLPNDKTPLTNTRKNRSSFRSLSPESGQRKSIVTPDNVTGAVSRSAGKSFLPVPISKDTTNHVKSRKNLRQPLQVQNTDLGAVKENRFEEKVDNNKVTSKSVDLAKEDKSSEQLNKGADDEIKAKAPVPKPRIKKTTEIATNTEEIYYFKPKQLDKAANKTFSSNSSDSINKQTRLSKFIDVINNREKTTLSNKSRPVSSRSVQTSYRKSSIGSNKHADNSKREIQTQTSYKPTEQNSSNDNISNYTDFIEDCAHEGNLFDSLIQPNLVERFSTSYDEYGLLENSKKPWRVDENLNLPTRNSIHLNFIKSASHIEAQQLDTVKQVKQYKEQRKNEKQIDSSGSIIEITEDNGETVNETLVKSVRNDDVESSVASFRPEVEVNTGNTQIESSPVVVAETAIEKRASIDAVSEWVANVNNEFKNTDDDDSPCSFYEDGEINSVEKTGRSKIAKALFQSDTGSDKGSCSGICTVLNGIDCPTKDVTEENNDDQMNKNMDETDGVFKVPLKRAVRSVKSKKIATPRNPVEISESDTSGVRKSGRSRRPPQKRYNCIIVSRKNEKCFAEMLCNLNSKNCSTIMSSSVRTSVSKKKNNKDKTPKQKTLTSENGKKNIKNQLFPIPENSCENRVVNGSNSRGSKKKRKTVLAESSLNIVEDQTDQVKEPKQLKINNSGSKRQTHTNVNTTRKKRTKKSVSNETDTNEILDNLYNNYEVDADKEPQLDITQYNREITHESYQYDKITNPSKYISSDSGRSTLIRSSIDDLNVRSGRVLKPTVKRKSRRRGPPKNATTKAKDLNNVNDNYEKSVPSETEKFKYIEENPKFNQHEDNLKYSDPLQHTNGASMIYLEIPPGEIKKKHTNRKHNLFYSVVEGRGRVYIGDEVSGIEKKSRFLIPTGLCYSIINDGADETLLLVCVKMPIS